MKLSLKTLFAGVLVVTAAGAYAAEGVGVTTQPAPTEAAPAAGQASVSLEGLAVGTAIQDRILQGSAASFPASVGRVYCFNRVTTSAAPTTIKHVWIKDGAVRAEIPLNVGGSPWRTWSNNAVDAGSWSVEVRDASDVVVDTVAFTVTEDAAAPAAPASPSGTTGSGY